MMRSELEAGTPFSFVGTDTDEYFTLADGPCLKTTSEDDATYFQVNLTTGEVDRCLGHMPVTPGI